jgi:uncharacterized protein YigE (DUF2233 family)
LRTDRLQLFLADAQGNVYGGLEALRKGLAAHGQTLVVAMNAGMYRPDYSPVGLFVVNERELAGLNRATGPGNFYQQPNGVFFLDDGAAKVVSTEEYGDASPHPQLATQSGPKLVHRGAIPSSSVFRSGSTSRKIRNGVCAPSPALVTLVISESPVTFVEFAQLLRDHLHCQDALYLDGSVSSLYSRDLQREDHRGPLGPILGVVK